MTTTQVRAACPHDRPDTRAMVVTVEDGRAVRDGRNGNELTHQRLTDTGRAPSFYDCLVEVEPATAHRLR
ncbi:MAG: hypothetical protein ABIQ06_08465 [Caldimonas sp.]